MGKSPFFRTLISAAVMASGLTAVAAPPAAIANSLTIQGCIEAQSNFQYLLVRSSDLSLLEIDVRDVRKGKDGEKSVDPGQCWEFDTDLNGKSPTVFTSQATYAGVATDMGDWQPETNAQQGKEAKKDRGR